MNVVDLPAVSHADAVAILAATPTFLAEAMAQVGPAGWSRQPAPGEFSLLEHACHLRDLEREGYLVRVRRVLAEDRPALQGFDGTTIAASRNYPAQDGHAALGEFAAARVELMALIEPLGKAQLAREATFMGRDTCLADVIAMMVEHDRGHIAEIQALLRSFR